MMRIITGKARGTRLDAPKTDKTRLTTEMAKEGVFSSIQFDLEGRTVLDLFAGSGQLGLEALSRGARQCVFVDVSREAQRAIKENLEKTRFTEDSNVYYMDVFAALKKMDASCEKFDIIFMDPPYNKEIEKEVLYSLANSSIIDEDTVIIVEASMETKFDYLSEIGLNAYKRKEYKTNVHMFITKAQM